MRNKPLWDPFSDTLGKQFPETPLPSVAHHVPEPQPSIILLLLLSSTKPVEHRGVTMAEGLIFTNEQCVGCNRCVRICSSFGASVSDSGPKNSSIRINSERCIVCGACIDVCTHDARQYLDDTDRLFADLEVHVGVSQAH